MYVFPAIDMLDGKAVRLFQGDYDQVTVYNDDIVAQAGMWVDQGAKWLHMVDLDGARSGRSVNLEHIAAVTRAFPDLLVQVGGGIRTLETAQRLVEAGVSRVILGTALITSCELVSQIAQEIGPDHLVAGIDARDGMVAIEGWCEGSEVNAAQLVGDLSDVGIKHLVYTDIRRDGAQSGIDAAAYRRIAEAAGFPVIVSGGVTGLDDIAAVRQLGETVAEGVIVGRALYEDNFSLSDAIGTLDGTRA
ncbi:MAG: 1-(5-phosphoribosyl)-5-[(5-phosphoribosylamino)methylideneamino]imidazole-4-carboxamide isomerase [Coriobacteriia bacterium]|nr:1-(5-phosphoribosyl)-5-[(5-phosphoribosylamino)methylideneamino]imidazole-4-carboxamide isomerase [Coriobacteriia bacterium]